MVKGRCELTEGAEALAQRRMGKIPTYHITERPAAWPTATNFCCPAAPPHVTPPHCVKALGLAARAFARGSEVPSVHVIPLALVATSRALLATPFLTATNFSFPAGPPHVTDCQTKVVVGVDVQVAAVHVDPVVLWKIPFPVAATILPAPYAMLTVDTSVDTTGDQVIPLLLVSNSS